MRAGEKGNVTFTRTDKKGDPEEVFIAFAPVEAWTLEPVNSSDFSEGVTAQTSLVYSVGFGITVKDLERKFFFHCTLRLYTHLYLCAIIMLTHTPSYYSSIQRGRRQSDLRHQTWELH